MKPWTLQSSKLAYVIPAFNEGEMLGPVIEELRREAPPGVIVVVDDASSDDTGAVAAQAGAKVVRHPINRGQGAALQTGFDAARKLGADIVVTFDADGQHHPADVRRLLENLISSDSDVALGSRFLSQNQIPWLRRIVLRLGVAFTRIISRIPITDTHNGLRAIRVPVLPLLRLKEDRMAHASELLDLISAAKIKFVEVPCTIRYSNYSRAKGQRSSAAPRIAIEFLFGKLMR
jgi:glycosyltransferase involved in cell wall biosynthesis